MNAALVIARRLVTERRVLIGGVSVGASLTLLLQVAMYPSIRDSISDMSDALPEAFTRLVGSADFASPEGFLQAEAFGTMAPVLVILVAISVAASGIPGAEASGRMTMLATSANSRRTVALGAALSILAAVTTVVSVYWLTTIVGSSIGDLHIAIGHLTAAAVSLWLLGLAVGGVAFGAGAATGTRGATIGVATTVALGSFLTNGLLPLSERFAWGRRVSLWYPYADHRPLTTGFDLTNALVLLAVAVLCVGFGLVAFERRDLG